MTVAQGVSKQFAYKKQSAKGTAASGSGGQLLRRETATFSKKADTYSADEITSHQQHTGDVHGIRRSDGTINGLLSAGTYSPLLGSLLRKDMTATASLTALSLTIGGSGPYTVTRGSGDFLVGGIKIGDVVRLAGGSLNASNVAVNLLVTGVTATVLTVIVPNGSALVAEGPIASCTVSVPGKKSIAAASSQTNDYYTFEEYYSDLTKSYTWPDAQIAKADISLPSSGNATIKFDAMGLGVRTKGNSQVLTSPTVESTASILTCINGAILIGGTKYLVVTSASVTIDGGLSAGEAVIGSNVVTDNQRGTLKVSGTVTILYDGDTVSDMFDNETATSLVLLVAADSSAAAEFVSISLSRVKIFGDDADDGKKQIVRTYPFVAEINGTGGAALANDKTICSIQDSLAA